MRRLLLALLLLTLSITAELQAAVYDCFLFLNEYEILDIRLHELAPVVDKFVIVEAVETFRGSPKPLNFQQHASRYAEFADKIIYVVVEQLKTNNPWERESFQRNQILRGLKGCDKRDVVMISDVDEIIERKGVHQIRAAVEGGRPYVGVTHRYHSNFLNSVPGGPWRGTVAAACANVHKSTPQGLRGAKDNVPSVANGWHFTWQGGLESDLYKMSAYSHSEHDTPQGREAMKRNDEERRVTCPLIPVDDSFPFYVRENQEYFESIGFLRKPG
jgi:hypothetical protein